MEDSRTLEALVTESVKGDEASFGMLSKAITRPLFPFLCSRTVRREDAFDALQDTLVEVWHALPRFAYRSDASFFKFVFTIGRRRLARIRNMRVHEEPLSDEHDVADTDALENAQHRVIVSKALQTLSGKDKDIVTLRYWSGLSFLEIGTILSMNESAVRVRHHRALHELQDTLTPYVA